MPPLLPKVLVVEDDPAIRTMIAVALRREPVSVDVAPDGAVGIDLVRQNRYAVMVVDLMMPHVNGFDFLEYVRSQVARPRPVVFVMTACDDSALRELEPGVAHGVLRKPFDIERLVEMICDCARIYTGIVETIPIAGRRSSPSA